MALTCGLMSVTERNVSPPTPGATTQLQDWINRSTAAGVVQALRFPSSTNVTTYTHQDGMQGNVVWNPNDGIIGDGCMQINVFPSDGTNSGNWRIPLNASWTSGGGQTQGMGTGVYYTQFRVKLGPNRLTPSVNGGGFKICINSGYNFASPNSSASDTGTEIVCGDFAWNSHPIPYYYDGVGGPTQFATPPLFTWTYLENTWITVYIAIKLQTLGGTTGNTYDLYFAADGDTSYTHLFQESAYNIGTDSETPNGHNGLWLLPYDSLRTSAGYTTFQSYDQIIISTQPIACPQIASAFPAPLWFSGATSKNWIAPLSNSVNSVADPLAASTNACSTGLHSVIDSWGSLGVDPGFGAVTMPAQGGHNDYAGNEEYFCNLRTAAPAWVRRRNATAGSNDGANHRNWGDGRPTASHGYNSTVFAAGRIFSVGHPAVNYQGGNQAHTALFEFLAKTQGGLDNTNNDWIDQGSPFVVGGGTADRWGGYDPSTLSLVSVTGGSGNPSIQLYSLNSMSVTNSNASAMADSNNFMGCEDTTNRIVLINNGSGWFWFPLNLINSGGTWHSITPTGTVPSSGNTSFVWHPASAAFITWLDGTGLVKIKPTVGTNSYSAVVGTVISSGGLSPPTPFNGLLGRIGLVSDMGDGRSALVIAPKFQSPDLYVMPIPSAGI